VQQKPPPPLVRFCPHWAIAVRTSFMDDLCRLTQFHLEKWPLKRRDRQTDRQSKLIFTISKSYSILQTFSLLTYRKPTRLPLNSNLCFSLTSCARGDTICLRPLQVDNVFAFIRQVAPVPACWLFKTSATS